jgi:hypothetical protein
MSSHGEWYPSYRHIFGIWLVWSLIIVVIVLLITGTVPVRKYRDDGELRHSVSSGSISNSGNSSGKNQSLQMGNGLLLSSPQITRTPRKPSHLANRIGWTRPTGQPSIDLLQRTFSHSPTSTADDSRRHSQAPSERPEGVRTESPIPSSTGLPGGSAPRPSDAPTTPCTDEGLGVDVLSSQIPSPVPTDQDVPQTPVETLTEFPTVLVTESSNDLMSVE